MGEKKIQLPAVTAIVGDDYLPKQGELLSKAVNEARTLTFEAHTKTLDAIKIIATEPSLKDAIEKLCPKFLEHVRMNFRVQDDTHLLPDLHVLEEMVRLTNAGLNSHALVIRQWGTRKDDIRSETGAPVGGWVPSNMKDYAVRMLDFVSPGGCLDMNYTNNEHIVIYFGKITPENYEWTVDTVIHEATHKFANSRDFTRDAPWKRAWEYAADYRRLGVEPVVKGDWAELTEKMALRNAYGLTIYMHYMPDTDLKLFAAGIKQANRAIGNRTVFDSISNDSL
jgi:hypothetical protein